MRSILLLLTLLQLNNIRLNSLLSRGIRSKNVCYSQTASIRQAHHSFPVLPTGFKLSASRARASGDKTALLRIKSYLNNFRIPQSLRSLSFFQQTIVILAYYFIHVTYLSQTAITLPFELFPTHIRNIGLDSLAGILCIFVPMIHNRVIREGQEVQRKVNESTGGVNLSLNELIHPNKVPWRRPRQHPLQSALLILFLFSMYVASGLLAPAIITFLNVVALFVPLTVPMQRNLLVVIAHFAWVIPAAMILSKVEGFFGKNVNRKNRATKAVNEAIINESQRQLQTAKTREEDNTLEMNMTIGDVINLEKGDDYFKDDLRKDFNVQADDVALNRVEISLLSQEDQLDIDRMTGGEFVLGRERNVEEESSDRNLTKGMGVEDEHDNKNKIKNANRNEMKKENENSTTDLRVLPTEASKKNKKIVTRYGRKETPGFWKVKKIGASDWMTFDKNSNWVWWAAAGYSVSVLLFRVADWLNGSVVPSDWFDDIADNIVHQMVTPEGNDIIALLIGAIAPCLSAPLWEEIFYRGLIYPFLCSVFPMALATPLSALIFALHHGRKQVFIQLFTLGSLWASLYVLSGNLFVSVVVHSLWNSRVFLGSFLGY